MADRSLNEDVGVWLRSVVALPQAARAERALRENMVETVGDLLFLASTRADLDAMGLGAGEAEPVWKGVVAARAGGSEASLTLETDAAAWMGARGHAEAELILRENLVETLGDLAFLAAGAEDLQALGFAPSVAADLSPILRQLETEPEPEPPATSPQPRAKRKAAVVRAKVSPRPKKSSPRAAAIQPRGTLDMEMDALAFLKTHGHGAGEMEAALRENMVETLGDLLFLVNTRADLDAMGLGAAAANLWPILSAAARSSVLGSPVRPPVGRRWDDDTATSTSPLGHSPTTSPRDLAALGARFESITKKACAVAGLHTDASRFS